MRWDDLTRFPLGRCHGGFMMRGFSKVVVCAALGVSSMAAAPSHAADAARYPARPIEVVIPFPPGGTFDVAFRALQPRLTARLGVPVVVVNKTGAGGTIGTELVAKSPPDGYTLSATATSTIALVQMTMRDVVKYRVDDLVPIGNYATDVSAIVVDSRAPWKTLAELLNHVKNNPGKVNVGTPGQGSVGALVLDAMLKMKNLDVTPVPFRGSPPANLATMGGEVDFSVVAFGSAASLVAGGKLRALAVTGQGRLAKHPEIPTLGEVGITSETLVFKLGVYAPAGTPELVLDTLSVAVRDAVGDPVVIAALQKMGLEVAFENRAAAAAYLAKAYHEAMDLGSRLGTTR